MSPTWSACWAHCHQGQEHPVPAMAPCCLPISTWDSTHASPLPRPPNHGPPAMPPPVTQPHATLPLDSETAFQPWSITLASR